MKTTKCAPCPMCGCQKAVPGDDGDLACERCGFFRPSEPPPRATFVLGPDEAPIYHCPHCGNDATDEECDVLGAEFGCLFCNQCNREFAM
jgi:hypothetical protein